MKIGLRAALAMVSLGLVVLSGCHGGSSTSITVQIEPSTSVSLDEGQSYNFTATVANDLKNQGVSWSLVQTSSTACSGAGCGTLQNETNSSATYVAPTNLTAGESVTLTATSAANKAATATVTISVVLAPTFTTITLPNGANGMAYNQKVIASGGIAPLKFSVASGLPPGLSMTQAGTIVGTPSSPALNQPAATFSFTVTVADSAVPPVTVSQAFTITVTAPSQLSITTTSLAPGFVNGSYNEPIVVTGGVAPYTWSSSGSLPPGLSLNPASGQITGVGTAPGTYPFTVQVRDSTLPSPGQTAQVALSIALQNPPPLAITTTSLASGVTATAYPPVSLQATGGIQPYTWSVVSGLLPAGLTLDSTGKLAGTPILATQAPDQFTVQVQDSEASPQTQTKALTLTIAAGTNSGNSLFQGQYAFLFKGYDSGGPVAIAGTLSTDGDGNVTSGQEDSNRILPNGGAVQVVSGIGLAGTYSIGTDGRGTLQLVATNPRTGVTLTTDYRLVLDSNKNFQFIENNDITTPGVGTDTLGTHGEGTLKPVLGSAFTTASLNGNYAFEFSGPDLSGKPAALAGAVNADSTGILRPAGGSLSSDFNDAGTFSSQNISGTYSFSGSRGAAQMLFEAGGSQRTLTFAFYFVSPSNAYFVETDSPTTTTQSVYYRLSGEMVLQPSSYQFTNSSLAGASVVTGTGVSGGNASVIAGLLTSPNGDGSAGFIFDTNSGGTVTSQATPLPGTYTAANNGRVVFTSLPTLAVAYLTGPGSGFILSGDASVTTGLLEQQTATSFNLSSVLDGYTLGAAAPGESEVPNVVGQVTADGAGSITGTVDEIDAPTASSPEGTANLGQLLIASVNFISPNGRGTIGTNAPIGFPANLVFYMVSPGNFRAISADSNPGNDHPEVFFFDH
jgi:Putative Ig domain